MNMPKIEVMKGDNVPKKTLGVSNYEWVCIILDTRRDTHNNNARLLGLCELFLDGSY